MTPTEPTGALAVGAKMQPYSDKEEARAHELILDSLVEISKLAEATEELFRGTQDSPTIHGIMMRISVLTDVIFYAQKIIKADDPEDCVDISKLDEAFKGRLYA